jgi:dienelactone hydrolase
MNLPALLPALLLALTASTFAEDIVTLPGTQPLTMTGDLSAQMHEAALRDMDRRIADTPNQRPKFGKWESGLADERIHLSNLLGGLGMLAGRTPMERYGDDIYPALVAETSRYRVWQVRWNGPFATHGEGLLLEPRENPRAYVVAVPDADQTPEQIVGLAPGVPAESQFARRLAENGFGVIVPVLINRSDADSGNGSIGVWTNEPNREWIYRQAYMMGKHLIGCEVEKVFGAMYCTMSKGLPVGIVGYGEGGLIALYASATAEHVAGSAVPKATLVSGYFKSRQNTWEEPIYRNVWGLLRYFGDAEIAAMVEPAGLVVEYSSEPAVDGPPPANDGRKNCAAPGKLSTPPFAEVEAEFKRIDSLVPPNRDKRKLIAGEGGKLVPFGSKQGLVEFARMLGTPAAMDISDEIPKDLRQAFDPRWRQEQQLSELEGRMQACVGFSNHVRDDFFLHEVVPEYSEEKWTLELNYPRLPIEPVIKAIVPYREDFWKNIIGKIEDPLPPPNARTRKIYDEPKWTGYEVVVDVDKEGFGWGILCVPKDLKPGEKRPVVVCQHGRNGLPQDVITGDKPAYRNFAARLADQGFITFAPHNLYRKEAYYRTLSRMGNTIGLSMFSVIIRHHQQWLNWLGSLPFVDPQRIAFYGLSYGGESAVRIPPLLDGYCLSICSGDFNDWPRKVASTDDKHSFMFTDEWEMPYFNMGNTFSYAELTYLMFPRPFMVERGHHDQVAPDSWVASEYAKTRYFYDQFGLGDRTAIEFFNGGHTINGQGTFDFLHKHLNWPPPAEK